MTINYDNQSNNDDYYDFIQQNEEEFMQMQDSNQSYSILPVNNV